MIQKYAQDYGFDLAKSTRKTWNGYKVYVMDYEKELDVIPCTGYPMFILVKDDEVRVSTHDEAFPIMDSLYGKKKKGFENKLSGDHLRLS